MKPRILKDRWASLGNVAPTKIKIFRAFELVSSTGNAWLRIQLKPESNCSLCLPNFCWYPSHIPSSKSNVSLHFLMATRVNIKTVFFFPSTFSSSATSAAIAHFFWLSPCYGKLYPHILLALEKKLSWINVTTWASTQDFVFHPQLTKMIPDINFFWFQFYIITSNDHFCHLLSFLSTAISWITNFYHVGVCPRHATGSKEATIFAGKEVS